MSDSFFVCPICGNKDQKYIGCLNSKPYCRKCITFRGKEAVFDETPCRDTTFTLEYSLSKEQKNLSDALIKNYVSRKNSLVKAVCGSGKTEIVIGLINYLVREGKKVAFAIPRRDVVIELSLRLAHIFKDNKVTTLYGGHTDELYGDIICLTTHQLFRYEKYFDLIILDEIDAFPFKDNEVLNSFFYRALKGNYVLLSATPSDEFLENFKNAGGIVLELNKRFHGNPLPVPQIYKGSKFKLIIKLYRLIKKYKSINKQVFIFCPTIDIAENLFLIFRFLIKGGMVVHSKKKNRNEIIEDFRNKKIDYLFTTAVLERGVTVKDLQVIVYRSNHKIYDRYSLTQIAGRVGRKKEAPNGDVYFLSTEVNNEMVECIRSIKTANQSL